MLVYARSDAPQYAEGVWSPRVSAGHGEAGQTAQHHFATPRCPYCRWPGSHGDGDSGGGGGGDDDDDSMEDDEDEDKVLEEDNGSGLEEEEEEEQDPLQEDHVDVTNLLHVLNRSLTPLLPPDC